MSSRDSAALVSAVIPTRNRPALVCRAVRSALAQSYPAMEAVVVIDGPDPATEAALAEIGDPRLRVIALAESLGGNGARNTGVEEARGEWIALLDDDDEWLSDKIESQMKLAEGRAGDAIVVASRYIDLRREMAIVRPMAKSPEQPLSEYLFCERTLFSPRKGFVQTSTWLTPRALMRKVRFTPGLKCNQDTDWLLKAAAHEGAEVVFAPEVLAIFHNEDAGDRVSMKHPWTVDFEWGMGNRELFTPRAFAFLMATHCLPKAMDQQGTLRTAGTIWRACWKHGKVGPKVLGFFAKFVVIRPVLRALVPRAALGRLVDSLRR